MCWCLFEGDYPKQMVGFLLVSLEHEPKKGYPKKTPSSLLVTFIYLIFFFFFFLGGGG